jgi:hypothetical protein
MNPHVLENIPANVHLFGPSNRQSRNDPDHKPIEFTVVSPSHPADTQRNKIHHQRPGQLAFDPIEPYLLKYKIVIYPGIYPLIATHPKYVAGQGRFTRARAASEFNLQHVNSVTCPA